MTVEGKKKIASLFCFDFEDLSPGQLIMGCYKSPVVDMVIGYSQNCHEFRDRTRVTRVTSLITL